MGKGAKDEVGSERLGGAATRTERLAAALRDNLRKRKAQARARTNEAKKDGERGKTG